MCRPVRYKCPQWQLTHRTNGGLLCSRERTSCSRRCSNSDREESVEHEDRGRHRHRGGGPCFPSWCDANSRGDHHSGLLRGWLCCHLRKLGRHLRKEAPGDCNRNWRSNRGRSNSRRGCDPLWADTTGGLGFHCGASQHSVRAWSSPCSLRGCFDSRSRMAHLQCNLWGLDHERDEEALEALRRRKRRRVERSEQPVLAAQPNRDFGEVPERVRGRGRIPADGKGNHEDCCRSTATSPTTRGPCGGMGLCGPHGGGVSSQRGILHTGGGPGRSRGCCGWTARAGCLLADSCCGTAGACRRDWDSTIGAERRSRGS